MCSVLPVTVFHDVAYIFDEELLNMPGPVPVLILKSTQPVGGVPVDTKVRALCVCLQ